MRGALGAHSSQAEHPETTMRFSRLLTLALAFVLNERGATATYSVTTSKTDVNGVWRKVQAPLQEAAQYMVDEWDMLDEVQTFEVDWSAREITMPLDLSDDVGVASIP